MRRLRRAINELTSCILTSYATLRVDYGWGVHVGLKAGHGIPGSSRLMVVLSGTGVSLNVASCLRTQPDFGQPWHAAMTGGEHENVVG